MPGLRLYDHRMIHERPKYEVPRTAIGHSGAVYRHLRKVDRL
ncbi:hypothetical protein SAMN05216188_11727 [Lentzea xinjiangensis]|uniref:Uncharacterized protein n=1 Tax=Lentzea xinjiangensis TaxID=402600 RepID=A0A1H9SWS4_9PSEU|nr:hypothetical protein [Lentzea xinjiangensis]SER89338.1 hypothetical protein SAMN05216188_11727 [Lentzea xinjiangensis]